jgi:hypothetical protein
VLDGDEPQGTEGDAEHVHERRQVGALQLRQVAQPERNRARERDPPEDERSLRQPRGLAVDDDLVVVMIL